MLHAQGELSLGDPKLTYFSFDLCYLIYLFIYYFFFFFGGGGGGHPKKLSKLRGVMQFLNGASRIPPASPPS